MPGSATRANALDHVVVVLFENRSLDNVLGRLYGPGDGKAFEGVIGKELSNPIPGWAQHGAGRKVVPYGVTTDMDSPVPDPGEEWYHTNTQLFGAIDDHNRFKIGEGVTAPWNAPPPGAVPAMDGFVADYISTFTGEVGRQPAYEEYAQIMTGYTPQQLPVLSGIAREFGVFDHWFSEVPSQTFMNRSFWTAATSSGLVVNSPVRKWFTDNDAETIFERLEQHGRTWKVYVMEPMCLSFTGVIHYPRLKDRLATHFVRFSEFEKDAAAGTLPDFSLIEPDMIAGHGDYHPAFGRSFFGGNVDIGLDPSSAMLGGEAFLERVFNAYRSATAEPGANVWNTTLLIGWDEPGGTYDHVPPGPVPPPDPAAPAGEFGFTFDRSGYRVPAIIVSPWVEPGGARECATRWDHGPGVAGGDRRAGVAADAVVSRGVAADSGFDPRHLAGPIPGVASCAGCRQPAWIRHRRKACIRPTGGAVGSCGTGRSPGNRRRPYAAVCPQIA